MGIDRYSLILFKLDWIGLDKLAEVARVGAVEQGAGSGRLALLRVNAGAKRIHVRLPPAQVEQLEFPDAWHDTRCY